MLDINNLSIILSMKKKYNYKEYVSKCEALGAVPDQLLIFAQRVGILEVSKYLYPGVDAIAAYQKLLAEPPVEYPQFAIVTEQSRGLGDTVAKITHATGLVKLAELYTQITGKDCGCKSRQEALNKLFPYGVKEE